MRDQLISLRDLSLLHFFLLSWSAEPALSGSSVEAR